MIRHLDIGGANRPIDFNFNCLEEFEEMTGTDALNGMKVSVKNVKALIFCGLKYGLYPEGADNSKLDFDLKKVGSWLNSEVLVKAMTAFNSQGQKDGEEKKTDAQASPNG